MAERLQLLEMLLKYLRWPLLVLCVCLVFRKSINSLLERVKRFGIWKTGFDAGEPLAQTADKRQAEPISSQSTRLTVALEADYSPSIRQRIVSVRKDIESLGNVPDQQVIDILVTQLAVALFIARAETVYGLIFGSQLSLLKRLNTAGPLQRQEVEAHYEQQARQKFPDFYARYPFERYVGFLIHNTLVAERGGEFAVVDDGREFLAWMARVGRTEFRPW